MPAANPGEPAARAPSRYVPAFDRLEERCVLSTVSPTAAPVQPGIVQLAEHRLVRDVLKLLADQNKPAAGREALHLLPAIVGELRVVNKFAGAELSGLTALRLERSILREGRENQLDIHVLVELFHLQGLHSGLAVAAHTGVSADLGDGAHIEGSEVALEQESLPGPSIGITPVVQRSPVRMDVGLKGPALEACFAEPHVPADTYAANFLGATHAALDFVFGNLRGESWNGSDSPSRQDRVSFFDVSALAPEMSGLIQEVALVGFNNVDAAMRGLLVDLQGSVAALIQIPCENSPDLWFGTVIVSAVALELTRRHFRRPVESPELALPTMRSAGFRRRFPGKNV